MAIWTKPSGIEIEINDNQATVEYAKSLGWTNDKHNPEKPPSVDDMSAEQLKAICKDLGIEYEGKKEAIKAVKAAQAAE